MANAKRLQKTLDNIMKEIESWGQGLWGRVPVSAIRDWTEKEVWAKAPTCGASFCMAGHAALAAGHTPLLERGSSTIERVALKGKLRATLRGQVDSVYMPDAVREWLGLTVSQADRLFEASNSLAHLFAYSFVWTGGRIVIPDWHAEFTDGDDEYSTETNNLPQDVKEVLEQVDYSQWPDEVWAPYLADRDALLAKLDVQIERADAAEQERSRIEAAIGS